MRPLFTLTFLGALLCATTAGAQSPWQNDGPPFNTQNFNSIQFLDANRGFLVGDNDMAFTTTDRGQNWTQWLVGSGTKDFQDVWFTDPMNGWIIRKGAWNDVYRTTDGGATWNTPFTGMGGFMAQIVFTDANHGWIVGMDGHIARTTDGGDTWTDAGLPQGQLFDLNACYFLNANKGFVSGEYGAIMVTTDGGNNWQQAQSDVSFTPGVTTDIDFVDSLNGFVCGSNGKLRTTTDGGNYWTFMNSPTTEPLRALDFVTPSLGWVADADSYVHRTSDGGATWTSQYLTFASRMFFLNANEGWITGMGGDVYHTTTSGVVGTADPVQPAAGFQLYPNPATERVYVQFEQAGKGQAQFALYALDGRCVHATPLEGLAAGVGLQVDLPSLPHGIYSYRATWGNLQSSGRLAIR